MNDSQPDRQDVPVGSIAISNLVNGGWRNVSLAGKDNGATTKKKMELSTATKNVLAHIHCCSNECRVLILLLLEEKHDGATNLVKRMTALGKVFSQPTVSSHLARLLTAGIIDTRQEGKYRPCSLTPVGRDLLASICCIVRSKSNRDDALMLASKTLNDDVQMCVELANSLAQETRIKIMRCLRDGQKHVGVICDEIGAKQSAISYHLALLLDERTLSLRKDGRENFYSLTETGFAELSTAEAMEG